MLGTSAPGTPSVLASVGGIETPTQVVPPTPSLEHSLTRLDTDATVEYATDEIQKDLDRIVESIPDPVSPAVPPTVPKAQPKAEPQLMPSESCLNHASSFLDDSLAGKVLQAGSLKLGCSEKLEFWLWGCVAILFFSINACLTCRGCCRPIPLRRCCQLPGPLPHR